MSGSGQLLDFNTAKPLAQIDAEHRTRATVDADDIKARLNANPRAFVEWLFSGRAHISRGEARIGDVSGTPGASLAIQLVGPNVGLWHDHATGEGGDLIALYQAYMGYHGGRNFQLALKEIAREFLGDPVEVKRADWQLSATDRIAEKKQKLGTKPREDMQQLGAPIATYRYTDLHGNQVASVVRFEPDGTRASKTFRPYCLQEVNGRREWRPGAPERHRPLYRLPAIIRASTVVLCEGEGKADALASLGIDATSAMQGSKAPVDKTDWDVLKGKTVIIWPDNDEAGRAYARSVAVHLVALGCTVQVVPVPEGKPATWDAEDCVAEGGDPHELLGRAVPWTDVPAAKRVRFYTLDELADLPPPDWLIDNIITEGGLALLWAGSDSYKTFFAIDIGMCVATGHPWHGHQVKAGLVLYVAAEDESGVKMRMLGWRATRGKELPPAKLLIHRDGVTLTGDDGEELIQAAAALPEKPKLIIIDTLARTFGAGNENQTQDMNAYVLVADRLRAATGATVLIIHHTGRNTDRERGNLALRGACNTIITVQRDGDRLTLVNQPPKGKQKNAEPFADIPLRMQKVSFGYRGTEQTTLIVMPDDEPRPGPAKSEEPTFGKVEQQILKAINEADEPLGLTRLQLITHAKKNSLLKALGSLVDKEALEKIPSEDGTSAVWRLR
jgi:hypothetical protein